MEIIDQRLGAGWRWGDVNDISEGKWNGQGLWDQRNIGSKRERVKYMVSVSGLQE